MAANGRSWKLASAGAGLALIVGGIGAAQARPEVTAAPFSTAELEDLQQYAKDTNQKLSEVREHFSGQSEFASLVTRIRSALPESFVSAEWGYGSGTIVVKPGAQKEAERVAAQQAVNVLIIERDALSELERDALVQDVTRRIAEIFPSREVLVSYDLDSAEINITLKPQNNSGYYYHPLN